MFIYKYIQYIYYHHLDNTLSDPMDLSLFYGRTNSVFDSSSEFEDADSPDSEFFDNKNKIINKSDRSDG